MGFLDSVTNTLGSGLGKAAGGILGGALGGAAAGQLGLGGGVKKSDIRMGHEEDTRSYKARDEYDWAQAKDRGLTPQEFYGSSAAGGSAASGGAQILGNSIVQREESNKRLATDSINRAADRQTDIQKAEISAQATRDAAETSAGASKYSSDTQRAIAENRLNLDRDTYKYINLPSAAANIGKTEKQTEELINKIATSEKDFVLYMKKLSMGVDNMLSEMYQSMNNFDVTKPKSLQKFSPQQRQALLAGMLALQSQSKKEISGITETLGKAGNTLLESLFSIGSNPLGLHKPIEAAPGLGNKFNPPKSYKKPGYAGPQPYKNF